MVVAEGWYAGSFLGFLMDGMPSHHKVACSYIKEDLATEKDGKVETTDQGPLKILWRSNRENMNLKLAP